MDVEAKQIDYRSLLGLGAGARRTTNVYVKKSFSLRSLVDGRAGVSCGKADDK